MKVTRTQKLEIEKDSFLIRRIVWQSKYTVCVPDNLVDRVREIQRRHPTDDKQTELSRDLIEKHQLQSQHWLKTQKRQGKILRTTVQVAQRFNF